MVDIVEKLDRKIFNSVVGRGRGRPPSVQMLALRNMAPGDTLAFTHDGYATCIGVGCSLHGALRSKRGSRPDVAFSFRHLPDGRLGVACFAKEK